VKTSGERDNNESSKRLQGPSKSANDLGLCHLSFQYLMFIGIPSPLCHLIFNMLECVYGYLGGHECFTRMMDVQFDLKVMMDNPKFLKGLDLLSTGLQVDTIIIPRKEEFDCIKSCYSRCVSGSCQKIAIVK
jgi:hypothetical protein